ncbi:dynamin family protein [Herbaspirillum huttiense]|uniref:dynamin family protein n=1 Tax=Herbaspirillum huttiense TaxID=863372 RepID=UPI0039AEA17F
MSREEQRFIDSIGRTGQGEADLQPVLSALRDWLGALGQAFEAAPLPASGLQSASPMSRRIAALHEDRIHQARRREQQWIALAPARALAQRFEGKLMLLVFGKFNAGKSSLCNFLAQRFRERQQAVQYFHLQGGQLVESEEAFHEGAIETTARLQGVCLGDGLVLLDTPGLHSATGENAALTQRFLDSADAVLWLTSSTSPGQVQELDELARELRRGKPLLPVLTRSDVIDEDEVDGQIVKCLRNKSDANRADQEADVRVRAAEKLQALGVALHQLKAPVSVSAYVARTGGADEQAMLGAGFERLYAALSELLAPALAYRDRKPAEVLLHHLQEDVLAPLQGQTLPALQALQQLLGSELAALPAQRARIVQLAWREVMPGVPALLEQHAASGAVDAVLAHLQPQLLHAFDRHARAVLDSHVLATPAPVALVLPAGSGYERVADDLPPSYEKLYEALSQSVLATLEQLADEVAGHCTARMALLSDAVSAQQDLIEEHARRLACIEQQLRPVPEEMAQR